MLRQLTVKEINQLQIQSKAVEILMFLLLETASLNETKL